MIVNSLQLLIKFGLILILFLIITAWHSQLLCQTRIYAVVTYSLNNGKFDRSLFEQITSNLNNEADLNAAVIIIELDKQNSHDQLEQIQTALEGLIVPYRVLFNYNNQYGNQDFYSIFNDDFGSDEFVLVENDRLILGINSTIPNFSEIGFVKVETLNRISEETDLNKINNVYIFSNNSIDQIQNQTFLLNLLTNKSVFSFYTTDKKNLTQVNLKSNIVEIGIPSTFSSESAGYFLLENKSDSIFLLRQNLKPNSVSLESAYALKDIKKLNVPADTLNIDQSLSVVFEKDYNSSSKTLSITSINRIYTLLNNGLLYLNDNRGKEVFITELIGRINNNPVLYKDLLLAGTIEGDLYSINSNNGEILQVVGIGEKITTDLSLIELDNSNSKIIGVVFGTSEGNIFCYDAFTFQLLWKKNISQHSVVSKPEVVNDKIVFISSNSSLYCVSSKSGSLIWKYEFTDNQNHSANNYPISDGKKIFSLSDDGNLFAIDLLLGNKIWSINTKGMLNQFYISTDKQKLFFLHGSGLLLIYSAKDGKELAKIDFIKSNLFFFIIEENSENIFVGFSDGSLYSIDAKFNCTQLISPTQIPIASINLISNDEFILKDINGKITLYKIN